MFFVVHAISLAAMLTGAMPVCAQSARDANSENSSLLQTAVKKTPLVQPAREDLIAPPTPAVNNDSSVGPDDLLNISVFEAPEMNTTLRVSPTGYISMQLLGEVHAAGLTPRELQSVLQELLRRTYMKDPHVGVFIQELQSHPVSVVGAVKMAGVFQIRGPKTLLEILSMAQGLADDAGDTVSILHGGEQSDLNNLSHSDLKLSAASRVLPTHEILVKSSATVPSAPDKNSKIENINLKRFGILRSHGERAGSPGRRGYGVPRGNRVCGGRGQQAGRICFAKQREHFHSASTGACTRHDAYIRN
jgi:protein involved in polysaccharide export with SLBB domain